MEIYTCKTSFKSNHAWITDSEIDSLITNAYMFYYAKLSDFHVVF